MEQFQLSVSVNIKPACTQIAWLQYRLRNSLPMMMDATKRFAQHCARVERALAK